MQPGQVLQPESGGRLVLRHPSDGTKFRTLDRGMISEIEPLLKEVLVEGKLVATLPTLDEMRRQRQADVERLDPGVRRIMNPHIYHVSLTQRLYDLKKQLIEAALEEGKALSKEEEK
jgi:nicotinate phosphoribosyltransferase